MRLVRYHQYGGPEVLAIEEAPTPVPGPGQALIKAEAIGANFVDTKVRQGPARSGGLFSRPLPGTLTGDVVGVVEAVGPDVEPALVGRRVAALVAEDAFADYSLADAQWLAPAPAGLDLVAASMLPMGAPVALRTLRAGRLAAGDTVLVHAAAGGIGHLALQLAKLLGAGTVIGTAGSPAKLAFVRSHGADVAVDYTDDAWPDRVREVAPNGVDVVLDSVGGDALRRSLDLLAPFGRVVLYGVASSDFVDIPVTSLFALRSVVGFALLAWRAADPKQARADMAEVAEHMAAGRLRTALHAQLPLADVVEAHRILDARANLGRVLLIP